MIRNFAFPIGIRLRLALLYLGLFGIGVSIFCFLLFQYFKRSQVQAFDSALYNFVVDVSRNLEVDYVGRLLVHSANSPDDRKLFPFHLGQTFLEIRNMQGRVLLQSRNMGPASIPFSSRLLSQVATDKAVFRTLRLRDLGISGGAGLDVRAISFLAFHESWSRPLILQVAVPLDYLVQEQRDLLLFFLIGIPTFFILCGLAGLYLSSRALKPIRDMTVSMREMIDSSKIERRLSEPSSQDEIRELAVTFNSLLDRLDQAFSSQERFVSNASHQLKTPLSILQGELDLLRRRSHSPEEVQKFLISAAFEVRHLINLVEDLLMLARVQAGQGSLSYSEVRLDEVVLNVVSRLQRLAKPRGIEILTSFSAQPEGSEFEAIVDGDEDLLDSMIESLIENAIKYSADGQSVEVRLESQLNSLVLFVRDHGVGLSDEMKEKLFERFSRGSNVSQSVAGSGLGLSIAQEIAALHHARIEVSDLGQGGEKGTELIVDFPRHKVVVERGKPERLSFKRLWQTRHLNSEEAGG